MQVPKKNLGTILIGLFLLLCFTECGIADKEQSTGSAKLCAPEVGTDQNAIQENQNAKSKLSCIMFESKKLQKEKELYVYTPPGYNDTTSYPVLYLLHGAYCDAYTWVSLGITEKADRLLEAGEIRPAIMVFPQIDNSFGVNSSQSTYTAYGLSYGMYEDYLLEIIAYIDEHYHTIPSRAGRYIGGFSMGGYAALYLAFTHEDMFGKVGGHSPQIMTDANDNPFVKSWLYPYEELRKKRDPLYLAQHKDLSAVSVYLDCGDTDSFEFFIGCEELQKRLTQQGAKSEYHLNRGGHDFSYWSGNLENYLRFYLGKGD